MKGMLSSEADTLLPRFWRDRTLPFVEARSVEDGRHFCYAKHAHETFSIGAVTGGRSIYLNGRVREQLGADAVVVVNPEEVHACNPCDDQPWSYPRIQAAFWHDASRLSGQPPHSIWPGAA